MRSVPQPKVLRMARPLTQVWSTSSMAPSESVAARDACADVNVTVRRNHTMPSCLASSGTPHVFQFLMGSGTSAHSPVRAGSGCQGSVSALACVRHQSSHRPPMRWLAAVSSSRAGAAGRGDRRTRRPRADRPRQSRPRRRTRPTPRRRAPSAPSRCPAARARRSSRRPRRCGPSPERRAAREHPPAGPRPAPARSAWGTVSRRSRSFADRAAAPSPFLERETVSSMLDWPEHSNTSPTRMSDSVWAAPDAARASSVNGPPAPIAGSSADQRPEASARALACSPLIETLTVSPAAALPHTAIGRSRCRTAWSWKMEASSGLGEAWSAAPSPDAITATASAAAPPHVNDARLATRDLPADALPLQRAPHVRCAGQRLPAADADLHRGLRQCRRCRA